MGYAAAVLKGLSLVKRLPSTRQGKSCTSTNPPRTVRPWIGRRLVCGRADPNRLLGQPGAGGTLTCAPTSLLSQVRRFFLWFARHFSRGRRGRSVRGERLVFCSQPPEIRSSLSRF